MTFGGGPVRAPSFGPSLTLTRRVDGLFDIITNGIAANFGSYNFSLNDLPNSSEFTALFQTYCIEEVSITWRPEYTQLSDAAPVSNAVNTSFNTALNIIGATPTSVDDVLQYSRCSTTQINVPHTMKFRPVLLMDNTMPCFCAVTTLSPSLNWWGVSYAVPATGTPMTFRSTAVFKIRLAGPY